MPGVLGDDCLTAPRSACSAGSTLQGDFLLSWRTVDRHLLMPVPTDHKHEVNESSAQANRCHSREADCRPPVALDLLPRNRCACARGTTPTFLRSVATRLTMPFALNPEACCAGALSRHCFRIITARTLSPDGM